MFHLLRHCIAADALYKTCSRRI